MNNNKEEHYKLNPIYGADFSKGLSHLIESIRNEIADARGHITDITYAYPQWKERVDHVKGLLTCGLVALAISNKEIIEWEIKCADDTRGKSLKFNSRGIGTDIVPCCFVCGQQQPSYNNISAFVSSEEDGGEIQKWFDNRARLDFRPSEPNWIQVKVGCCDKHTSNLEKLNYTVNLNHGRIRHLDIEEVKY